MSTMERWYLEYRRDGSSKFYEVIHFQGRISKRWGRIGAPRGQVKVEPGTRREAVSFAEKKEMKGYEEINWDRLEIEGEAKSALTQGLDQEDAQPIAAAVNMVLRDAAKSAGQKPIAEDAPTNTQKIDALTTQAVNLVPLVVSDPLKYAADIAELREAANEMRDKVRRLDSHLETLDILLTNSLSA